VTATTAGATTAAASAGLGADVVVTLGLGVATIVVTIALAAWNVVKQQKAGRRQERVKTYAEALHAVEDYQEAPYRVLRTDGSATVRWQLSEAISDIQSRISFYTAWMSIDAPAEVLAAYEAYVVAAKCEAGPQMTAAWRGPVTKRNKDVPLGMMLPRDKADVAREVLLDGIRRDLNR
jgi:hypothetical protein